MRESGEMALETCCLKEEAFARLQETEQMKEAERGGRKLVKQDGQKIQEHYHDAEIRCT